MYKKVTILTFALIIYSLVLLSSKTMITNTTTGLSSSIQKSADGDDKGKDDDKNWIYSLNSKSSLANKI